MISFRLYAQAVLAPLIFISICVLAGLSAQFLFIPDHNATSAFRQDSQHVQLGPIPPSWTADHSKRGIIRNLAVFEKNIYACGPGLGVYRSDGTTGWNAFNTGLGDNTDTTVLFSNSNGLYAGTANGEIFILRAETWKLLAATTEHSPIEWLTSEGQRIHFASGGNIFSIAEAAHAEQIPGAAGDGLFLRRSTRIGYGKMAYWLSAWIQPQKVLWIEAIPVNPADELPPAPSAILPLADKTEPIYFNGSPLPPPFNTYHVIDVAVRKIPDLRSGAEMILVTDDIGLLRFDLNDGKPENFHLDREGLPLEKASSVSVLNDAVFVGTERKGIFRQLPGMSRFEPFNAGLLYLVQ